MLWVLLIFTQLNIINLVISLDLENYLKDQYFPHQTRTIKSKLINFLPKISSINCDIKSDIVKHTPHNITNVKLCKVINACFNMNSNELEIANTLLAGSTIPSRDEIQFLAFNGIRENSFNSWKVSTFSKNEKNMRIAMVSDPTLVMRRYLAHNTMHLLHDEILPAIATILHHKNLRESNDKRIILALDSSPNTSNDEMMTWLGKFWGLNKLQAEIRYRNGLKPDEFLDYICLKEAYVGLDSPSTSWYHYGYYEPQGPIEGIDRDLVGKNVRTASEWIKEGILGKGNKLEEEHVLELLKSLKSNEKTLSERTPVITILSRKKTRLILNERELAVKLKKAFPMAHVQLISQEEMSIEDLVAEVSDSIVLIGMHGALLSLAAFLPPESILIEMFPYGIPAENYTPYKTLAGLPSMKIKYTAWVNPRSEEPYNIGYPDREIHEGGLKNFPESYREGIKSLPTVPKHKCCYSPTWLYKIFQDTHVDCEAIIDIIRNQIKNN